MYRPLVCTESSLICLVRDAERAAAAAVPTVDAPVGHQMASLAIFNSRPVPVALADSEYPAWLEQEISRPERPDPLLFQKENRLPTRTELRLLNKIKIRLNNQEKGA